MESPAAREQSPTSVRYFVLAAATIMSVLLYLDRYAVTIPLEYIREDLRMTQTQIDWFVSAFFWAYALCQVPAGWLSDRFGARTMLSVYIVGWSIVMGLIGVCHAIWFMLWLRVICGAFQAGSYPTAGGLIRRWFPVSERGRASSFVGLGGRFGGVLAPALTAPLIVFFVSARQDTRITNADILNHDAFIGQFDVLEPTATKSGLELQRQQFVIAFVKSLPSSKRERFFIQARDAEARVHAQAAADAQRWQPLIDIRDWVPGSLMGVTQESPPKELEELVEAISDEMDSADFIDFTAAPDGSVLKLPNRAQYLLDRRQSGTGFSESNRIHLNRIVLETLFPAQIRKNHGLGWRQTLIVYSVLGILVTLLFAIVVRNAPEIHPWCNEAEKRLINDATTQQQRALEPRDPPFPWRAIITDPSLWGNSLTQFLTNVGWLFVVSSLPRYLEQVHDVSLVTIGFMTAFPMGAGILGLFSGGRWTDWSVRRFGLKWGRRLPLVVSRFTAALGYGFCLLLSFFTEPGSDNVWLPWLYVAGLCLAAASTDFGSPAIWAYAQDVGGQYTASILGWGNMWGNFGAAAAPHIYRAFLGKNPSVANWNTVFAVCCSVFVLAGFCAMLLDATKPVTARQAAAESVNES